VPIGNKLVKTPDNFTIGFTSNKNNNNINTKMSKQIDQIGCVSLFIVRLADFG